MLDLTKTILPAVDKVVEMGVADPTRLAIMGQSYGGYCALAMIAQTKRFKASIMVDGFGDLTAAYGQMQKDGSAFQTSITEQGQGLMGGTPWQFRDRYIENSPIFYLNRVETPLLIIHGTDDTTVAPFLSDEVFVALRRLGKEVEYVKYDGEGHSPIYWRRDNQIDLWTRVIGWLDAHVKGSAPNPGN
jgi:dipeptidyl aminopeptidase/acylaminoacyl peptidase